MEDARQAFDSMNTKKDVVTWNALIAGYGNCDESQKALACFDEMLVAGSIHADARKVNFERDVLVVRMLVDVYAKCGSLENAKRVFESLPHCDVACWNSIIAGYSQVDKGEEALQLYTRMQNEGLVPVDRTYVAVLNACGSLAGLEKGKEIHAQILGAGLEAGFFMVSSLIGMYGKCSIMVDARQMFGAPALRWESTPGGQSLQVQQYKEPSTSTSEKMCGWGDFE